MYHFLKYNISPTLVLNTQLFHYQPAYHIVSKCLGLLYFPLWPVIVLFAWKDLVKDSSWKCWKEYGTKSSQIVISVQIPLTEWLSGNKSVTHSVVSDSLQLHGLSMLLCPRNSPGKNTGVGFHALLQEISPTQGSNLGLKLQADTLLFELPGSKSLTSIYGSIVSDTQ